jgi:hypothetical protein
MTATMVQVIVRIDSKDRKVGQPGHRRRDHADSHPGVEQQGKSVADHEKAVHVAGLGDEVDAGSEVPGLEPVVGCHHGHPPGPAQCRRRRRDGHPTLLNGGCQLLYVDVSNIQQCTVMGISDA